MKLIQYTWACLAALSLPQAFRQGLRVQEITRPFTPSRQAFGRLVFLQAWKGALKSGIQCPKPPPCVCHCDCPATHAEDPPPPPPPCPIYPAFPTNPPPPTGPSTTEAATTTTTTMIDPGKASEVCVTGEVMRADGTCSKITPEIIEEIKRLVVKTKKALDVVEAKAADAKKREVWGDRSYYLMRPKVLEAHVEYRKVLDLMLAMLWLLSNAPVVAPVAAAVDLGPEFILGAKTGRGHCEYWSKNETMPVPDRNFCGIICRNEEKCAGFGLGGKDDDGGCVWYDKLPALAPGTDACQRHTVTTYVKKNQHPINLESWASIQRLHVFEAKLEQLLKIADMEAENANTTFWQWNSTGNVTLRSDLKGLFIGAKTNYTWTIQDVKEVRASYLNATGEAFDMVAAEVESDAPFEPTTTTTTTTTEEAIMATPSPLRWQDFPNSQDTKWSRLHPDCPMGTPCVCDCKCRGAPAQNFVEPPPPPPAPCPPPPPTPDPSRMSLPMGAPPALPIR